VNIIFHTVIVRAIILV